MGQKIELKTTQFGKNVIFDLNRSLSGQDLVQKNILVNFMVYILQLEDLQQL